MIDKRLIKILTPIIDYKFSNKKTAEECGEEILKILDALARDEVHSPAEAGEGKLQSKPFPGDALKQDGEKE